MEAEFKKLSNIVKSAQPIKSVNNDMKLMFYSLYKQATVGNINTSRPGMFDMVGKAKWDAWKSMDGKPKDDAMYEYINLVKEYYGGGQ